MKLLGIVLMPLVLVVNCARWCVWRVRTWVRGEPVEILANGGIYVRCYVGGRSAMNVTIANHDGGAIEVRHRGVSIDCIDGRAAAKGVTVNVADVPLHIIAIARRE